MEQSVFLSRFLFNVHRRAEDLTRELETLRDDLQVSDNIFLIYPHCTVNPISVFQKMKLRGLVINSFCVLSAYLAAANKQTDPRKYINRSQRHECRNWETEHYNNIIILFWR